MATLTKDPLTQIRAAFQLTLCQRDYELVTAHHPAILAQIERSLAAGASPEIVRRWALAAATVAVLKQLSDAVIDGRDIGHQNEAQAIMYLRDIVVEK